VLPDAVPVRPLLISAGSGITPIMSMLRSLIAQQRLPDVTHLHYAPHAYDVIFGNELRDLAKQYPRYRLHLVFTRDPGEVTSSHHDRHFSAAQLERACPDFRDRDVYACGPQGLLDSVEGLFRDDGLESRVHTERFRAPVVAPPAEVTAGRVRFGKSGVEASSDGIVNLLRIAEDAGLNPPHGCRMGICHGCDAILKSGCVRDLRTNALTSEAGQTIQICVSAAAGDAEVDL
jgi:ferredoxin-NADP reductase